MASKKANAFGYINALFNPNIAIRDGKYVHADGLFDNGADGLTLSDDEIKRLNKHSLRYNMFPLYTLYSTLASPFGASPVQDIYDKNVKTIDDLNDMRSNNIYTEKTTGAPYSRLTGEALDFWQSLSENERQAFLHDYDESFTTDDIIADLEELAALGKMPEVESFEMPLMSDYIQSDEDIYKDIDSELSGWYADASGRLNNSYNSTVEALNANEARLLSDLAEMSDIYSRQKDNLNDAFKQSSSNLRSQQYLANAQTYDALRSDLRRSRQNALEAGASAGVRIASNVNALLTAQNKQSATAMETSNALAEMLLQHRNAMSGITRDFANYRSGVNRSLSENDTARAKASETLNSGLNNLDTQRLDMRDTMYANRHTSQTNNYNTAMADYNAKTYNAGIGANKWVEDIQAAEDAGNPFAGAYRNWARK
jgi:hypothetical protein